MSDFSNKVNSCMSSKGLPPPNLETLNDVMEMIHTLEDAWETAGGDAEALIGSLLAPLGASLGDDAIKALGAAASITVTFYINSCISCLAAVGLEDLKNYVASNAPTDDYMRGQLASVGALADGGQAVA
jgi:hypothetical protein